MEVPRWALIASLRRRHQEVGLAREVLARWSDALKEAGFPPNQLIAARTARTWWTTLLPSCESLAIFQSRRDPTQTPERSELSEPQHLRKFGGMRALSAELERFCRDRGENDLAELCARRPRTTRPKTRREPEESAIGELAYVYLMKSGRFYKIGRTNALGRRERELVIQLPEAAKVVHSIKTDDPLVSRNTGTDDFMIGARMASCRTHRSGPFGLRRRKVHVRTWPAPQPLDVGWRGRSDASPPPPFDPACLLG